MGDKLRELVRSVVREELAKCGIAPSQPAVISVADVVRQEIRQAFSAPEPRHLLMGRVDYATVVGCQMSTVPTAATVTPSAYSRPQPPGSWPQRESRLVRKSAIPTCGAPRATSHFAITVMSHDMFIGVAPTARSGYKDFVLLFRERPAAMAQYLAT